MGKTSLHNEKPGQPGDFFQTSFLPLLVTPCQAEPFLPIVSSRSETQKIPPTPRRDVLQFHRAILTPFAFSEVIFLAKRGTPMAARQPDADGPQKHHGNIRVKNTLPVLGVSICCWVSEPRISRPVC